MTASDDIQLMLRSLPPSVRTEVLDYVEYLVSRTVRREEQAWSDLSLSAAMRGMDSEAGPEYREEDLRRVFA